MDTQKSYRIKKAKSGTIISWKVREFFDTTSWIGESKWTSRVATEVSRPKSFFLLFEFFWSYLIKLLGVAHCIPSKKLMHFWIVLCLKSFINKWVSIKRANIEKDSRELINSSFKNENCPNIMAFLGDRWHFTFSFIRISYNSRSLLQGAG